MHLALPEIGPWQAHVVTESQTRRSRTPSRAARVQGLLGEKQGFELLQLLFPQPWHRKLRQKAGNYYLTDVRWRWFDSAVPFQGWLEGFAQYSRQIHAPFARCVLRMPKSTSFALHSVSSQPGVLAVWPRMLGCHPCRNTLRFSSAHGQTHATEATACQYE